MSRLPEVSEIELEPVDPAGYSAQERALLLGLAHQSILGWFEGKEPALDRLPERLNEPRGVFTTIHLRGELRGCVGYVQPIGPLCQMVIMTARAAAFEDNRFRPVSPDEASELEVSLSVLSALTVTGPEEVKV